MRYRPAIIFAILGLLLASIGCAWVANSHMRRAADLERQNGLLVKQVRSQEWELKRVASLKPELAEARFLIETYRANDRNVYRVAKAAYKDQKLTGGINQWSGSTSRRQPPSRSPGSRPRKCNSTGAS